MISHLSEKYRGRRGRDRMVIGLTTKVKTALVATSIKQ
jgi:hypothetical protein